MTITTSTQSKPTMLFLTTLAVIATLVFAENNYDFVSEKAELVYFNDSFVKDVYFYFGKMNRTYAALNATFTITKDFDPDKKLMGHVKCFRFYHNEYRFNGIKLSADTCKVEKANIFHIRDQFREAQFNISLCHIKKGRYKIVNFTPQTQYFPDHLPHGRWRSNVQLQHEDGAMLFEVNWDFDVRRPGINSFRK